MRNRVYISLAFILVGITVFFPRCKEIEPVIPETAIKIPETVDRNPVFTAETDTLEIAVSTTPKGVDWNYNTTGPDWISLTVLSGDRLRIIVADNVEPESRRDTVRMTLINDPGNEKTLNIYVTQTGLEYSIVPDKVWVDAGGGEVSIALSSNLSGWTASWGSTTEPDWIEMDTNSDPAAILLDFHSYEDKGEEAAIRRASINVAFGKMKTTFPVTILQAPPDFVSYLVPEDDNLILESAASNLTVDIDVPDTNYLWDPEVEPADSWLTATVSSARSLRVSAAANTDKLPRTGVITLKAYDGTTATINVTQKASGFNPPSETD